MVKRKPEDDSIQPQFKSARSTITATAHLAVPSPAKSRAPPLFSSRPLASGYPHRSHRRALYLENLAALNYQTHRLIAQSKDDASREEGSYIALTSAYIRAARRLRSLREKTYGDVAVFGDGDCGQLGCGQSISEARCPRLVAGLRNIEVGSVACGGLHTLALTEDGCVYSFGCNDEGALGGEVVDEGYQPCIVEGFVPSALGANGDGRILSFQERKRLLGEATILQIAAGETTSLALSEEGDVYMWGSYRDSEGRKFRHLPPRDDDRPETGRKDMNTLEPDEPKEWYIPPRGNQDWPVHLILPQRAREIGAGDGWAAAILEDESLLTWGIGTHGEMGRSVPKLDKTTSKDVILKEFLTPMPPVWKDVGGGSSSTLGKKRVVGISCGAYHLLALTRESGGMSVYSCGLNQYGQLGLGNEDTKYELTKIEYLEGRNIAKVEAGYHFSCFVNNTGKELYACGRSDYGQLGISLKQPDSGSMETTPVRVPLVYDIDESAVKDPKGNCIDESKIVEEDQPEIEQISCGSTHVLVLTRDGDVYSWGFGESGACGQGKCDKDVLRPKKLVTKLDNAQGAKYGVKFVSGGGQHSAVVVATGSRE